MTTHPPTLLEQGVDGFALNTARRSPLSMSIETLPELSLTLLEKKSRYEYRWWGNDLFWFSFVGIILPLQTEQQLQRPVSVTDQNGAPAPTASAAACTQAATPCHPRLQPYAPWLQLYAPRPATPCA